MKPYKHQNLIFKIQMNKFKIKIKNRQKLSFINLLNQIQQIRRVKVCCF